jgi:hypothetical protein
MAIRVGGSEFVAIDKGRTRFRATTGPLAGQEVTRRGLEDIRSRERGLPSYRAFQELKTNPEYQRLIGMYAGATQTPRKELRRANSEFTRQFVAAYKQPDGKIGQTAESSYKNGQALFDLLYTMGFVRQSDFARYVRR